jgi:peptidyl-prolyl cis-trans isomerase D
LGLFNVGAMEKDFETAASQLKLNEISAPVKSKFGYHLIKVTELVPSETKTFEQVKDEVTKAYQKAQAETAFYEAGEKLTEMSYENPDNLKTVSEALKLPIKKSELFSKDKGEGIAAEEKIRSAAFTEEVLQGNNSTPVELGSERLVVLRMLDHKTAALRELASVKADIIAVLQKDKINKLTTEKAFQIKAKLQEGANLNAIADENKWEVKKAVGLMRSKSTLPEAVTDAIFKAAKPVGDKPTILVAALPTNEQMVISLSKVTAGVMSEDDKKRLDLAKKNIANAMGQSEFNAALNSLQSSADVTINAAKVAPQATAQ